MHSKAAVLRVSVVPGGKRLALVSLVRVCGDQSNISPSPSSSGHAFRAKLVAQQLETSGSRSKLASSVCGGAVAVQLETEAGEPWPTRLSV